MKTRNSILTTVFALSLTTMLIFTSSIAIYATSSKPPVTSTKNCVSSQSAGSFPFFKRVCGDCKFHFTNFNVGGTCTITD
jgi:hypothetical protein